MSYKLNRLNPEIVRSIVEKYKCDLITASILTRRDKISSSDIKYFLENNISTLHSPFLFSDMEMAVARIEAAVEQKEKICIFGDRDTDGITSTALLTLELEAMGLSVIYMLPENDDAYGLSFTAVEKIKDEECTLVITVDNGITCNGEIELLNSFNIDTIILDHHMPSDILPLALAIINPKVESCGYPFSHLSGCGVVAKLIWALRFSKTPFYHSRIILLHASPGPGEDTTTIIQACRLENLIEVEKIVEEQPNGFFDSSSKIIQFLSSGLPIFVLDKEIELKTLRKAFGTGVDISLEELRGEFEKVIPQVKNKSLFNLSTSSREVMYHDGSEELITLISLFKSYCIYKFPSLSSEYERVLDLACIATIADLMPLLDENRTIVKLGLKQLVNFPREILIPLLSCQKLIHKQITSQNLAWYICPVFNASGRLGNPMLGVKLLLSKTQLEAERYTNELISLNKERQRIGENLWAEVSLKAQASLEYFGSKFVVLNESIPRGFTGSIASKIINEFKTIPAALVLAEKEDSYSASIRSKSNFDSREFFSQFNDYFQDFGGHKCAGGFSILKENLDPFLKDLEEKVLALDYDENDEEILVDALIPPNYMNSSLMKIVDSLEPYGEGNKPLVFMIKDVDIIDVSLLGQDKKNIKLVISYGNTTWNCLYWNGYQALNRDFKVEDKVNIYFRLGKNYFKGNVSLQLTVLNIEKSN